MLSYAYKYFLNKYVSSRLDSNDILSKNELTKRITYQQNQMPDYLGFGIKIVALLFLVRFFFKNLLFFKKDFNIVIESCRNEKIEIFNDLIRFHDSLYEVANVEESIDYNITSLKNNPMKSNFDFVIIGSGPGGAVAAHKLQESGFSVCILERAVNKSTNNFDSFSYNQMINQYKHGGISSTLGNTKISYVEGSTLGGGSEVNSGLYHRTPPAILDHWKNDFGLKDSSSSSLEKDFLEIEKNLCISFFPKGKIPKASLKLKEGADNKGWKVEEVPRWFNYDNSMTGAGKKMTMQSTYLKEYIDNDGDVIDDAKVMAINKIDGKWNIKYNASTGLKNILSRNVILSAGTIGTAEILKNSGLCNGAGRSFQMHPTVKVVAVFNEKINFESMGVPVHQVKEFAPNYSFGCSISSKPYLRVSMLEHGKASEIISDKWENMAIYYCMILPEGRGAIKTLPLFNDPYISYNLTRNDQVMLADGLKKLCGLLFSAGASGLYPSIKGFGMLENVSQLDRLPAMIDTSITRLMSVHLFSSCPIGESQVCVADSYGKVFGQDGLYVSDGSMLPSAPGVNPQGTIMAFANRNIEKTISRL